MRSSCSLCRCAGGGMVLCCGLHGGAVQMQAEAHNVRSTNTHCHSNSHVVTHTYNVLVTKKSSCYLWIHTGSLHSCSIAAAVRCWDLLWRRQERKGSAAIAVVAARLVGAGTAARVCGNNNVTEGCKRG